jgi:hypothetical protein
VIVTPLGRSMSSRLIATSFAILAAAVPFVAWVERGRAPDSVVATGAETAEAYSCR